MMLTASEEGGSGSGAEESSHHTTRLGIYIFKEVRRFGFKREEEGGGFVKFVAKENSVLLLQRQKRAMYKGNCLDSQ